MAVVELRPRVCGPGDSVRFGDDFGDCTGRQYGGSSRAPGRCTAPLEALHVSVYFAPEPAAAYAALGMKGMGGYFASRSAPMGAVPAEVVTATFYVFSPGGHRPGRSPQRGRSPSPERYVEARFTGLDACWRRGLGDAIVESSGVAEAAELAREATTVLRLEGHPLYAGHAALPWPNEPHLQLWHAASLLREHRGDGHVAALVHADLDALESVVTYSLAGGHRAFLKATRGWSDEQWAATEERLRDRGLLDTEAQLTEAGRSLRRAVEEQTDAAAVAPWRHLGDDACDRLRTLVAPLVTGLREGGLLPPGV